MGLRSNISFTIHLKNTHSCPTRSLFIPSKYYQLLKLLWTLCITKIDGTSATHIYLPTLFILFLTLLCGTFYKTTTTSKQKQVLGYQKISKYFRKTFELCRKYTFPVLLQVSQIIYLSSERQNIRSIILGEIYYTHLKTV